MNAIQGYASSSDNSEPEELQETTSEKSPEHSGYSHNFFGLTSHQQLLINKSPSETDTTVKNVVASDKKQYTVEIPNSLFWNDLKPEDIQEAQNINERNAEGSNTGSYLQTRKRTNLNSNRSYDSDFKKKVRTSFEDLNKVHDDKSMQSSSYQPVQDRKLFFIHSKVQPLLHSKNRLCKLPSSCEWTNIGHAGATNRLKWNIPNYSHLLASCSMDSTIKLWNIWTQLDPCVQVLKVHAKAVKDVHWSPDGRQILSCSYDRTSCIIDAEKGEYTYLMETVQYRPGIQNPILEQGRFSLVGYMDEKHYDFFSLKCAKYKVCSGKY